MGRALVSVAIVAAGPGSAAAHMTGGALGAAPLAVGVDHLLAAALVGLIASRASGRAVWRTPVVFLGALAAIGGALALAGPVVVPPAVEVLVALTLSALGLLLVADLRGDEATAVLVGCGALQGLALGAEVPVTDGSTGGVVTAHLLATVAIGYALGGLWRLSDGGDGRVRRWAWVPIVAGIAFGFVAVA